MKELSGRTAVITGAASGIGRALSERFAAEGMKLVLADVEVPALEGTVNELRARGFDVLGVPTDVTRPESVDELARRALAAYGKVHLLCNNAGVMVGGGTPWERTIEDWQWCFGVNFWGVLHGIRTFVPIMLQQDEEAHVVNTASSAGLYLTESGVYSVTKQAVVGLSEYLYDSLRKSGSKVGASVVCPDAVRTRLLSSARNRPDDLGHTLDLREPELARGFIASMKDGWSPAEIAGLVADAVRENRFWVLALRHAEPLVRRRFDSILNRRNPD